MIIVLFLCVVILIVSGMILKIDVIVISIIMLSEIVRFCLIICFVC